MKAVGALTWNGIPCCIRKVCDGSLVAVAREGAGHAVQVDIARSDGWAVLAELGLRSPAAR
ncbi:Uncharacterised protein [Mycobacterium tuberculosis]|nr:Uncharacterised protein [Mycobacterium tuberculosis]